MLTFSPGENVLLVETEKYAFGFCARTGRVNKTRKQKNTLHTLSRLGCTSLSPSKCSSDKRQGNCRCPAGDATSAKDGDRKSTRLNSSHRCISYAVFCLKKKK